MLSSLGLWVSRWTARLLPEPFVIAVILTLVAGVMSLAMGPFPTLHDPSFSEKTFALLDSWRSGDGLWKFLTFSMQMCLILVTGHALASSPPFRSLFRALSTLPRGTAGAALLVCALACLASLINWGLGLIVGAILARDIGRSLYLRGIRAHYPLIVAAGFAGFMVWHGGLSGSAPLSMTTMDSAVKVLPAQTIALLRERGMGSGLPLSLTLFSPLNGFVTLGLIVLIPLTSVLLSPRGPQEMRGIADCAPSALPDGRVVPAEPPAARTFAEWLDRARVVNLLLAGLLIAAFWRFGRSAGLGSVGLNEVNIGMLALGLVLHGTPRSYQAAIDEAARGCGGIILQFPLYGGILSMLVASGLDTRIAGALGASTPPTALPVIVYFLACALNMLIPSGGGQWAVQGPIALEAGMRAGIEPGTMVMAVAYGDQTTNMLQVFWALPLLAITGVKARDIVGYTALLMFVGMAWMVLGLVLFS
ncbi:MAG: short-chain fatty acid transporter [Phycisphaerae bacterium]|nr:short-chain fatty acid transporter [Phycisphaerae bacterium]